MNTKSEHESFNEDNIFYVISRKKNSQYELESTPRIGKVLEDDDTFSQSFCIADNLLVLSECIATESILGEENVLFFFMRLKTVNYFIEELEKYQNDVDKGIRKNYLDVSKKMNLINKKDVWLYFYKNNMRNYRFFVGRNEEELFEVLKNKKEKFYPRALGSLSDLKSIKKYMEDINNGKENRYNKIESVEIQTE